MVANLTRKHVSDIADIAGYLAVCRSEVASYFACLGLIMRCWDGSSPSNLLTEEYGGQNGTSATRGNANLSPNSGLSPQCVAARTNIRFMFQAMVTRLHSPRTLSSPRSRNWRNPSADLMMPNTGSGVCLRKP